MLDEQFEMSEDWAQDEDGCIVVVGQVDGVRREFHHQIPDDSGPHVPSTECGCGPQALENPDGVILFEHLDQDEEVWDVPAAAT